MYFSYQRHAKDYLHLLFKLEKKKATCQQMADELSLLSNQALSPFTNSEKWGHRVLFDRIVSASSELLGEYCPSSGNESLYLNRTALLIDGAGVKKGGRCP